MISRIIAYRTRHFKFRVPIDAWNEKKIPLPEGAGAQFIAPSDLTAILLEPFYYDWSYETDGRITGEPPVLVYGKEWIGEEIRHFPWCKELFEFLDWLKEEYGWCIFADWQPFCKVVVKYVGRSSKKATLAFQRHYNLELSGYVWEGDLRRVGERGLFWSASEYLADGARSLYFDSGSVVPKDWGRRYAAASVRCVSE